MAYLKGCLLLCFVNSCIYSITCATDPFKALHARSGYVLAFCDYMASPGSTSLRGDLFLILRCFVGLETRPDKTGETTKHASLIQENPRFASENVNANPK
jgi:hypothetical protein